MAIGIESFRQSGDRLVLAQNQGGQPTGVVNAKLPFKDRFVNFFKSGDDRYGTQQQRTENATFKTAFLRALEKSEGPEVARRAVQMAGAERFMMSAKPMSERKVKEILDAAQHIRKDAVVYNQNITKDYLRATGTPSLQHAFHQVVNGALPDEVMRDPDLIKAVKKEIQFSDTYPRHRMGVNEIDTAAQRGIQKYLERRQGNFAEAHPGLNAMLTANPGICTKDNAYGCNDLIAKLDPGQNHALGLEPQAFRDESTRALELIRDNAAILGTNRFTPEGWTAQEHEIADALMNLQLVKAGLGNLAGTDVPGSQVGLDLVQHLITEVDHQIDQLNAKFSYIQDMREADPLSNKMVAYSNMLWAHAVGFIIDDAIAQLQQQPNTANAIQQLQQSKTNYTNARTQDYTNAPPGRTILPGQIDKSQHPATLGKTNATASVRNALHQAGFTDAQINEMTSSKALGKARQRALNQNPDWAPVQRKMIVSRDGVTRTYQSHIKPGASINGRFARRYAQNGPLEVNGPHHSPTSGISSATKGDHYHARNLKVSELYRDDGHGNLTPKTKVIGHGVLDMWEIADPQERQRANERGATEVLEAAITTNDRIMQTALTRMDNNDPTPVKVTHVSVNLITPASIREIPLVRGKLPDYQENTYTQAQFQSFDTASNQGQPMTMKVDDERVPHNVQQDQDINVQVDVIAFSFGINPLATGTFGSVLGGWGNVYEHNRGMMVKFIGDLGEGDFGSAGTRPGGFIGSVFDRLDPNVPAEKEMLDKIADQTNTVRQMFTSETFKKGNGDPAKMGRHILALQSLAEEALALKNVTDEAATMSKGCKSDKDRGGVTDVELKHLLITDDMGGRITPDTTLERQDQENYYVVASSSGQLENQRLNTGLAGSKEAGKLGERIPSKTVRTFLSGLGAFASE